ncbi:hypothetical protein Patl1_22717 [Pistacia atlantica]|uniref:Uncharacterized protein n=1 Tax=Pistacia atlantica TaxID=434234 RepID=A0ACC0ZWY1_9ROSI|nr:hypothetical protein Patl1_22717 [Pistacia atlantica]
MDSIESCSRFDSLDEVPSDRVESLVEDEGYESLCEEDYSMCMQHEAGHFLVGYLLGVLPKGYEVPGTEALRQDEFAAGRVKFVGFEFLKEVSFKLSWISRLSMPCRFIFQRMLKTDIGQVSNRILNNFSCIILGGLVAAHLVFGYSKGHHSDIDKLERVFKWLGYRKSEAISQVKWAALNTLLISHRNSEARSRLAKAMATGRSVSLCIETIENAIHGKEI